MAAELTVPRLPLAPAGPARISCFLHGSAPMATISSSSDAPGNNPCRTPPSCRLTAPSRAVSRPPGRQMVSAHFDKRSVGPAVNKPPRPSSTLLARTQRNNLAARAGPGWIQPGQHMAASGGGSRRHLTAARSSDIRAGSYCRTAPNPSVASDSRFSPQPAETLRPPTTSSCGAGAVFLIVPQYLSAPTFQPNCTCRPTGPMASTGSLRPGGEFLAERFPSKGS